MTIILGILVLAAMVFFTNVTHDPDAVLWVLLGAPLLLPTLALVLWLLDQLLKALTGRR